VCWQGAGNWDSRNSEEKITRKYSLLGPPCIEKYRDIVLSDSSPNFFTQNIQHDNKQHCCCCYLSLL
jgi:phosphatidylinositol kinase/protein kinase (PI-3  family)